MPVKMGVSKNWRTDKNFSEKDLTFAEKVCIMGCIN